MLFAVPAESQRKAFSNIDELALALEGRAGEALHLLILHDAGCAGEPCSCSPSFELEPLTPATFAAGAAAERAFRQRRSA